jgi:peptide/nickel transport system substrate-binding protein
MASSHWARVLTRRLTRRRALATTGLGVAGAALIAACGGDDGDAGGDKSGLITEPKDETSGVKRGGVYKASLSADLFSLEPQSLGGSTVTTFLGYTGLLRQKDGILEMPSGEIIGDVARSWEVAPDRLSVTFKINSDAHFAPLAPVNGRSADAQDVVASWERFTQISSRRSEFSNQINPGSPITSMTAPDSSTVVVKLAYEYAPILGLLGVNSLGTFYIVPKEALDTSVLDVTKTALGTGPFYLAEREPSVRVSFKRNPSFKQLPGDFPYVDQVDMPIVGEYVTGLAQFKAGAIYSYGTQAQDVVQVKRETPDILLTQSPPSTGQWRTLFGNKPNSPFRDERVRQAYVFTWDREAILDASYNVSSYAVDGLEVDYFYESAVQCDSWTDWFLDARDEKTFGANARFFKHDPAAAKQLMSAAGHPNGLTTTIHYPEPALTPFWGNLNQIITQMVEDSGLFKVTREGHNFIADFTPNYQNARGNFDGLAHYFLFLPGDPVAYVYGTLHSGGSLYAMNDTQMEEMINKALREFDTEKRKSLIHDVQRHEGGKMFMPRLGGATGYSTSWPVVRNWGVFRNTLQDFRTLFLDPEQPPVKRA